MFPVIFSFAQFELRTINVFLVFAFLLAAFAFWRKGKEEHYSEMELMDGFLLSLLVGFVLGRFFFILFNFTEFGLDPIKWFDIFAFPGINRFALFSGAGIYLYKFALQKKWDVFEILDFAVIGMSISHIFIWLGMFFEGAGFGVQTNLPVGMIFPGVFEKHHPVQLYYVIFYIILSVYLSRVEYRYRLFDWYRFGKKTAQTGFLTSMFFIWIGIFNFLIAWVAIPQMAWYGVRLDMVAAIGTFLFGLFLLGIRSGRISTKFFGRRNKRLLETFKV